MSFVILLYICSTNMDTAARHKIICQTNKCSAQAFRIRVIIAFHQAELLKKGENQEPYNVAAMVANLGWGRWTHRLIPDIYSWINRRHGDLNFYLTQILSRHECIRRFLFQICHDVSLYCPTYTEWIEGSEHRLIQKSVQQH